MPAISRELLFAIAALATTVAIVQALIVAWRKHARRARILARVTRAGQGEALAVQYLASRGYEITGAQVAAEYPVVVDDRLVRAAVRADYIVRKGDASYVVEVKTGSVAPRIETTATRRQLLEYRVAFDVDGVLLLDAEAGRLHAVSFPSLAPRERATAPRSGVAWGLVALAAIALVIGIAIVSRSTP